MVIEPTAMMMYERVMAATHPAIELMERGLSSTGLVTYFNRKGWE